MICSVRLYNTHKIFERLLLWSFPLITDVHVPGKKKNKQTELIRLSQIYAASHLLHFLSDTAHLLVKISEEVDPECMLFVKFVTICILYCLEGLGRGSILQEDVPV